MKEFTPQYEGLGRRLNLDGLHAAPRHEMIDHELNAIWSALPRAKEYGLSYIWDDQLTPDTYRSRPQVVAITHHNPWDIILSGIPIVLTLAAIFSDGKVRVGGIFEAQLPPIGEGIERLRSALRVGDRPPRIDFLDKIKIEPPK